jgi:acyl dehydratase
MVNRISKNDVFQYDFSFCQEDVVKFAEASEDINPIYIDDEFASKSIFKRTIVHVF